MPVVQASTESYLVSAIVSCGSVYCISKNKRREITRAGTAWDPGALTLDCELPQDQISDPPDFSGLFLKNLLCIDTQP